MTSPAQFAANRLNAQKSTGPITPAGKARAARSSLWHGLTAASLVVLDEDEADFDNFHTVLGSERRQRRREEQDEWEAEEPEDRILRPGDPDYPKPGDKLYMGRPEDWLDEK